MILKVSEKIDVGKRVDIFLTMNIPEYSRSFIKEQIKLGKLFISNQLCDSFNYKLNLGDEVRIEVERKNDLLEVLPWEKPINVVYEDENIIVVNKDSGVNSHPIGKTDNKSILNAVYYYLYGNSTGGYVRIMHRLDKSTSGALIFSKNPRYTYYLTSSIQNNGIKKEYIAAVKGDFFSDFGEETIISKPLKYNNLKRLQEVVKDGVFSETVVLFTHYNAQLDISILKIKLNTGRKHQIRAHLKSIGYPILGDLRYGGELYDRVMLHAWRLVIVDLESYTDKLEIEAPMPNEFIDIVED